MSFGSISEEELNYLASLPTDRWKAIVLGVKHPTNPRADLLLYNMIDRNNLDGVLVLRELRYRRPRVLDNIARIAMEKKERKRAYHRQYMWNVRNIKGFGKGN